MNKLIDTGAVAAAYCVADESIDAFRRFHAALYAQQPEETATVFPDNGRLSEIARHGRRGVPDCINKGGYTQKVHWLAAAAGIQPTPTIRINGQDYTPSTPDALVTNVKELAG